MAESRRVPPMLSVVGRKHAGKTTLVVRLSAELTRRGHRVMTLKHGSHTFNLDPATTDTYRHYHEGNAERVAMVSPDKFALIQRWDHERSPETIAMEHFSDADIVLCEGFKESTLPKIEIHRTTVHEAPLWPASEFAASTWRVMVSDVVVAGFDGTAVNLHQADWLSVLTDWVEREIMR